MDRPLCSRVALQWLPPSTLANSRARTHRAIASWLESIASLPLSRPHRTAPAVRLDVSTRSGLYPAPMSANCPKRTLVTRPSTCIPAFLSPVESNSHQGCACNARQDQDDDAEDPSEQIHKGLGAAIVRIEWMTVGPVNRAKRNTPAQECAKGDYQQLGQRPKWEASPERGCQYSRRDTDKQPRQVVRILHRCNVAAICVATMKSAIGQKQ